MWVYCPQVQQTNAPSAVQFERSRAFKTHLVSHYPGEAEQTREHSDLLTQETITLSGPEGLALLGRYLVRCVLNEMTLTSLVDSKAHQCNRALKPSQ
ncbi:unnamed protein product [Arctogadus glacialis]